MRVCGTVEVDPHSLVLSTLGKGEGSVSLPGRLHSWRKVYGNHCTGGWVHPSDGFDYLEKRQRNLLGC
jgi:hypothetical protein